MDLNGDQIEFFCISWIGFGKICRKTSFSSFHNIGDSCKLSSNDSNELILTWLNWKNYEELSNIGCFSYEKWSQLVVYLSKMGSFELLWGNSWR
jgi:hypothetical protein